MDAQEFREFGKAAVDYIADYMENIRDRKVLPSVEPGYINDLVSEDPPEDGESWKNIMDDVERVVIPGITHWQSPQFHAYYPTATSYPSIVGEIISAGLGIVGFSWIASPACTELEVTMMNWMGKMLGLPEQFLNSSEGPGGGVLQSSASESTFVALLAAKEKTVKILREQDPSLTEADIKGRLVAYTSDQSNSSVEKAGLLGSMPMRLLPSDRDARLRGETLREAVKKDREAGLIPCYVVATLGTTGTGAFDPLEELGEFCREEGLWLHVDAAYAGTAFICEEYRHLLKGCELADSFNFNCHKWMLVNFDCSALWVRDAKYLVEAFNVERIYLKHKHQGLTPDYRHWQIPLGRRFRALKIWFVIRSYGIEGIRKHVRKHIALSAHFENLVKSDSRFEVACTNMGVVCFRLKGDDSLTQELLDRVTNRKNIYVIPCHYREKLVIRFVVCSRMCEVKDIDFAWEELKGQADEIVKANCVTECNILNSVIGDKKNIARIDISTRCPKSNGLEKSK